jgi:hypothetical protein
MTIQPRFSPTKHLEEATEEAFEWSKQYGPTTDPNDLVWHLAGLAYRLTAIASRDVREKMAKELRIAATMIEAGSLYLPDIPPRYLNDPFHADPDDDGFDLS